MNKSFSKAAVDEKNKDCAWLLKRQKDMYVTSGDNRSQFERDYTRILHSNSFRRMKHKTQVFFNVENDHICTRMEHVLHVESVSHSIAQALGLNCELTQAIAIGHDLGHTPFGHVGERILNNLAVNGIVENDETIVKGFSWEHLKNLNGEAYFWHERNSLRMVDKLDLLADDTGKERNLNLTFAVRDGIISHCGELKTVALKPRNNKKIDLYGDFIRSGQFEPATWEGCAVKIADKIAYLGRDIEDAIRLKFITAQDLEELKDIADENIVMNTTTLMHRMIVDISRESSPECGIVLGDDNKKLIDDVLKFNNLHIYQSSKFLAYKDYCKMILSWIFRNLAVLYDYDKTIKNIESLPYEILRDSFLDWIYTYTEIDYIPEDKADKYKRFKNDKIYGKLENRDVYIQAVIDYISGMTDNYAIKVFKEFITFE